MNLPNMKDAKIRNSEKSQILYDDYDNLDMSDFGRGKRYLI